MTIGIGGKTAAEALATLSDMTVGATPIGLLEYQQRITRAVQLMQQHGLAAVYLNAGTNLHYFTGTVWYASERLVGAVLLASGELHYIAPVFELGTLAQYWQVPGQVHGWQEDESPYALLVQVLRQQGITAAEQVGLDESCAFFITDGLRQAAPEQQFCNAKVVTAGCRQQKSAAELSLMQRAMQMTLAVHQATASMLYAGISTTEVEAFIDQAHRKVGASGSYFVIVLFGAATQYPHGVKQPQLLQPGDTVLIDTGCKLHHYISDITRTYVFGEANARQRAIWQLEKQAQAAAFAAAQPGVACGEVDAAARAVLASGGLSPDYDLPGLPHRTGHGIGLDIHEWPYLVRGNTQPLLPGMCFSNEPMICLPGEFGVRLEDHFYLTATGPCWFTTPAYSIDDPFGLQQADIVNGQS